MVETEPARLIVSPRDFGLTAREIELVRMHAATLTESLADVTERYYAHIAATDIGPFITTDNIDRLKSARTRHWHLLLEGDFAAIQNDYTRDFVRRFVENGIPHRVFVVAAEWFAVEFARLVDRSRLIPRTLRNELRIALVRFSFYDLALAHAAREVAFVD